MNEAQAIRLCLRHRDPVGFEFLVKNYRREAFFHAFALMGNQEDAADVCQESFRRAFTAIPKLVGLDQFYPWFLYSQFNGDSWKPEIPRPGLFFRKGMPRL